MCCEKDTQSFIFTRTDIETARTHVEETIRELTDLLSSGKITESGEASIKCLLNSFTQQYELLEKTPDEEIITMMQGTFDLIQSGKKRGEKDLDIGDTINHAYPLVLELQGSFDLDVLFSPFFPTFFLGEVLIAARERIKK